MEDKQEGEVANMVNLKHEILFGFAVKDGRMIPYLKLNDHPDQSSENMLGEILADIHETQLGQLFVEYLASHSLEYPEDKDTILAAIDIADNIIMSEENRPVVPPMEVFGEQQ